MHSRAKYAHYGHASGHGSRKPAAMASHNNDHILEPQRVGQAQTKIRAGRASRFPSRPAGKRPAEGEYGGGRHSVTFPAARAAFSGVPPVFFDIHDVVDDINAGGQQAKGDKRDQGVDEQGR